MKPRTLDLFVGLFVLAGLISLTALALKTANLTAFLNQLSNDNAYELKAEFDNIGSLKMNAPIKAAGVVVGHVTNISLDPKTYKAITTLQIDQKYQFNEDASIKIATTGLLGDQYISIVNGSETRPSAQNPMKDEKTPILQAHGKIDKVQSAIVLEDLISKFLFDKASTPEKP